VGAVRCFSFIRLVQKGHDLFDTHSNKKDKKLFPYKSCVRAPSNRAPSKRNKRKLAKLLLLAAQTTFGAVKICSVSSTPFIFPDRAVFLIRTFFCNIEPGALCLLRSC